MLTMLRYRRHSYEVTDVHWMCLQASRACAQERF